MRLISIVGGLVIVVAASTAHAAPSSPPEVWDGPYGKLTDVPNVLADQIGVESGMPAGTPFDSLTRIRRDEPGASDTDESAFRLGVHTKAGWFMSPQLGIRANRDNCEVDKIEAADKRLAISYTCEMGRFTSASKSFLLVCDVDRAGKPACARALIAANNVVNVGGKDPDAKNTIYETLSCKPTITAKEITLTQVPPSKGAWGNEPRVIKLEACSGPLALDFAHPITKHPAPPLFLDTGVWK